MIPKVAWTHWEGPMSWLRSRGLETFRELNPDWELNVIGTDPEIAEEGLGHVHAGDWTGWRTLLKHGGVVIDSDIIHLRPIPDEWLEGELCAQLNSFGQVDQMPILGAVAGNFLMQRADDYCRKTAGSLDDPFKSKQETYQAFGVNMLRKLTALGIGEYGKYFRIHQEAFCYYDWGPAASRMWTEEGPGEPPNYIIGVHWYGGHPIAQEREPGTGPEGTSWIERLACR